MAGSTVAKFMVVVAAGGIIFGVLISESTACSCKGTKMPRKCQLKSELPVLSRL